MYRRVPNRDDIYGDIHIGSAIAGNVLALAVVSNVWGFRTNITYTDAFQVNQTRLMT